MATSTNHGNVDTANEEAILTSDGLVHEGGLTDKSDGNGLEPLIKQEEVDEGKGIDGGADAKASVIEGIIDGHSETGANKKKRKNKNKKKRNNNKVAEVDSNTDGGGLSGQVSENVLEKDDGISLSGSSSGVAEILKDLCHEVCNKEEIDNSSHVSTVEEHPAADTIISPEQDGEENVESKSSTLDNKGSIENVDMNLKPSESETALAEELKALAPAPERVESLKIVEHSEESTLENLDTTGVEEVSATATPNKTEELNAHPDLKEQVAGGHVDINLLESDDVSNNNYLQSDSQDFENGLNVEKNLSTGSNASIQIPTVPNPSLDTVENAQHIEQERIVTNISAVGQAISDFINDRPGWKTQNAEFVDQAQAAVDKVLESASMTNHELVNSESSLIEKGAETEEIPDMVTKSSDSMNNLYQVDGDNEYPNQEVLSEVSVNDNQEDDLGSLTVNGVTFELIEQLENPNESEQLEIQQSQEFIVGSVSDEDFGQEGQEYAASGEIYYSPSALPSAACQKDAEAEILLEKEIYVPDANSEAALEGPGPLINEEILDATSHLDSECVLIIESPKEANPIVELVQEAEDTFDNQKVLPLENELDQVISSSNYDLNSSPQILDGIEVPNTINYEEKLGSQTNLPVQDSDELHLSNVKNSSQEELVENTLKIESISKDEEEVFVSLNENEIDKKLALPEATPLPLEGVQQLYNRQPREETKCGSFRRGLPCFATKSNSGESITDAFLESMNNQHFQKDELIEGQEFSVRNSLERGLTRGRDGANRIIGALQRWKSASIRRLTRQPNH